MKSSRPRTTGFTPGLDHDAPATRSPPSVTKSATIE